MRSLSLKAPSVLPSPARAMGGSLVVLRNNNINRDIFSHTPLTGNNLRTLPVPGDNLARICPLGNPLATEVELEVAAGVVNQDAAPTRPKNMLSINDNYCLLSPEPMARPVKCVPNVQIQNFHVSVQKPVLCPVVSPVPFVLNVRGQSQKKDGSPSLKTKAEINFVKVFFSVDHCVFAPTAPNVHSVANAQMVGGRLQKFWEKWSLLGANPGVVSIIRDGYILPFKTRPPLVRDPLIVSGYANTLRNLYLKEALHALLQKKAIEMVRVRTSLAFFNRLFIVPKPKMAANLGPQFSEQILERENIQNGNPRDNSDFLATRGMGDIAGFQRRLFPHSSSHQVPEISQVPFPKPILPVPGPPLWPLNSSNGVHLCGQRGQVNGSNPGYKDPPVPRRLVDSSPYQRILPPGHPIPPRPLSGVGLGGEPPKVRVGTQTNLRVCGVQVRSLSRTGPTDPKPLGVDYPEGGISSIQTNLPSQEIHVPDRPAHSNRETGTPGETPHEAHPVAPQKTLESPGIPREGDSGAKVSSPAPSIVDQGDKRLPRPTPTPFASCRSNLYRRLKRKMGCSLRRLHGKRHLVSSRKSSSYKLPGTKSCLTSLEKIPAPSTRKSRSSCHRQHHSGGIHQQGGRYEVRLTLCPSMATPVLVQSETGCSKGQAYPWSSECDCRQVVSSRPNHSDGMVSSSGFQPSGSVLASSPSGHVCNKVQLQTNPICVSSAGPQCVGSGCSDSLLGKPGHVCLPPSSFDGQGGQQAVRPSLQKSDLDSAGLAQHAMVLGPSRTVVPGPSLPTQSSGLGDSALQQSSSQESNQPKPSRMAPRAEAIKEQGFSSPVASRIEAPQRSSTRTVYEAKWSVFVRWCETSQVDFRSPSVKQIADFLQEKNLQPSTIDGSRSAIADKLGGSSLNVRQFS